MDFSMIFIGDDVDGDVSVDGYCLLFFFIDDRVLMMIELKLNR